VVETPAARANLRDLANRRRSAVRLPLSDRLRWRALDRSQAIGAEFLASRVQRVQSTYIRAPGLIDRQQSSAPGGPAPSTPRRSGMVYAIDGRERWLVHNYISRARAIRRGSIATHPCAPSSGWKPISNMRSSRTKTVRPPPDRPPVSRSLRLHRRRRRAYLGALCRLRHERRDCRRHEPVVAVAAHLNGWAPPAILDAYEAERWAVTSQVSRVCDVACGS